MGLLGELSRECYIYFFSFWEESVLNTKWARRQFGWSGRIEERGFDQCVDWPL